MLGPLGALWRRWIWAGVRHRHPRPQDELLRHVNADWPSSTTIDADKSSASTFVTLDEQARDTGRGIIEQLARKTGDPRDDKAKAGDLGGLGMEPDERVTIR